MLLLVRWAEHPPKWSIIKPGAVHQVEGKAYRHTKGANLNDLVGKEVGVLWDKRLEPGVVVRVGEFRVVIS